MIQYDGKTRHDDDVCVQEGTIDCAGATYWFSLTFIITIRKVKQFCSLKLTW